MLGENTSARFLIKKTANGGKLPLPCNAILVHALPYRFPFCVSASDLHNFCEMASFACWLFVILMTMEATVLQMQALLISLQKWNSKWSRRRSEREPVFSELREFQIPHKRKIFSVIQYFTHVWSMDFILFKKNSFCLSEFFRAALMYEAGIDHSVCTLYIATVEIGNSAMFIN